MQTQEIILKVSLTDAGTIMSSLNTKANEIVGIINSIQQQVSTQVTPAQPPVPPAPPADGSVG